MLRGRPDITLNALKHLVMPGFVLATVPLAIIARMTRSAMLEVLGQDYIRTAWAKGLRNRVVIIRHAGGWTSLLLGVASEKPKGSKVMRGEFLGRALGPLSVELRRNGVPVSPALIAASSVPLSNGGDNR